MTALESMLAGEWEPVRHRRYDTVGWACVRDWLEYEHRLKYDVPFFYLDAVPARDLRRVLDWMRHFAKAEAERHGQAFADLITANRQTVDLKKEETPLTRRWVEWCEGRWDPEP